MVFESLVADLLNRFLGDFVDNLDASQLNIGIWGGDVKLNNLEVKETALDELDLPVKLKFGFLSSLVLKIPWKNLYTEPVIADIEGLHLIVVPNKGVVYNEEKATKNAQDTKQKALARLEEARKNKRKPPDPQQDTFAEKMVTQVIKNLQVKIRSIHIRYEDKYTNRHRPFVAGISLEGLDFQTTDANWKATIHKETVKIIHKLVTMNNLAVYWNSHSELISDLDSKEEIKREMLAGISTKENRPKGFKYILEPITMEAKLSLNQKPENDGSNFKIPKIDLRVAMEQLALCVGKFQYQDILLFLEAQERFNVAARYLKYRPNLLEYRGHYRQWWMFAYESILEEVIRRKKHNWSWERMRKHRRLVRDYRDAWVRRQTEKNLDADDVVLIERAEKNLDVFNVNIARQQAEMEIDRRGLTRLEDQPQGWMNWAKSWWGSDNKKPVEQPKGGSDIVSKFNEAMTPEEKAKLFEAIDYQENTPPTDYPTFFVENIIHLDLSKLAVVVEDALRLQFADLVTHVEQRPSARAIHVKTSIKSLAMEGLGQPMLTMTKPDSDWLSAEFETNPLEGDYDQLVKLAIAPVLLKYHAPAVNKAADVFRPPESVRLNQLTAAAMNRYEEVKARSVTGLAHAVENRTKLQLDIQIDPATVVISEGGVYDENKLNLVADLGTLTIRSTSDVKGAYDDIENARLRSLMEKAYDKFEVRLSDVRLVFADTYKQCVDAKNVKESPLHIIRPTGCVIGIHKSSIDDLQLAKIRVFGDLPDVIVQLSDERLLKLLKLLLSIPTPPPEENLETKLDDLKTPGVKLKDRAKMKAIMEVDEIEEETQEVKHSPLDASVGSDNEEPPEIPGEVAKPEAKSVLNEQQVQLEMNLSLNQVGVIIGTEDAVQIKVMLTRMGCKLQMRTYDMVVKMHLGDLTVEQPQFRSLDSRRETLYVIDNVHSKEEFLVNMVFIQANPESPFFETDYKMTEQALDVEFKSLNITLHQEALMSLKQFGEQLSAKVAEVQSKEPEKALEVTAAVERQSRKLSRKLSQLSVSSHTSGDRARSTSRTRVKKDPKRRKSEKEESIDSSAIVKTRLKAKVDALALFIGSNKYGLDTMMAIESVTCKLTMKEKSLKAVAGLKAIRIVDCSDGAIHKNLLTVCGQKEMFHMDFVQYNRTPEEKKAMRETDVDMSVKIRFAQLRFVFLNLWVSRLLNWISPFQAEAAAAAAHAQAAAAEKATESAQRVKQLMEESPPKIHLDVELAAPTIVVPRKSTSYEVVLVDFGQLSVNNTFSGDSKQSKAVIDNMVVQLTSINCGSGTLSPKTHEIESKLEILKPMTFTVKLYRNLSFTWYKDIPEMVVDAELPLIDVSMSQHEYSTMMRILSGNLAEGVPPPPAPACPSTPGKPIVPAPSKQRDTRATVERKPTSSVPPSPQAAAEPSDARRIAFKFQMNAISASLYSGDSATLKDGVTVRDQSLAFASMTLNRLKMSGSITESGSMDVAISLHSFTMDDERPGATKITRLLDKKESQNAAADEPFVSLRFQQDAKANKHLEFTSTSFFLCLCPEFLGALSSFFVVPALPEDEQKRPEASGVVAKQASTAASTSAAPAAPAAPAGVITMKCKMREVEVILIENANEPETTQAMILSFSCFVNADHKDGKQFMDGKVDSLQIVSSYFAEKKRNLSVYPVLNPLGIHFKGTVDNATQDQEFNLTMDAIRFKVSPSIIRLLSAVSAGFAANQTKDPSLKSGKAVLNKYPKYWDNKPLKTTDFWWFNAQETGVEATEELCEAGAQDALELLQKPNQKCTVKLESFVLTMEAGSGDVTEPMILLEMGMSAEARNWTSALEVDASAAMQMSYYNEAFSVWEPVIEPVESPQGEWVPWKVIMEMRTHNDADLDVTEEAIDQKTAPPKSVIIIKAEDMINITVTKSFLQLLNQLGDSFEKAARQISPPKSRQLPGNSPYSIYNETGFIVKVMNSDSLKVNESGTAIDATHGDYVPLAVVDWEDQIGLMVSSAEDSRKAELRLELLNTFREVNVMRAEKRVIYLPKTSSAGKQWAMLVETSVENSRRLVSLSSVVQFVNHMDVPFEVLSVRDDTNLDLCGIVPVGAEPMNVALPLLYTDTGALYLKPANDQYETSNESISWHEFGANKRATLRCDQSDDTSKALFVELVIVEELVLSERGRVKTEPTYTVHLYPPLTFQNLLPLPLEVTSPSVVTLQGGEETQLNTIATHSIYCQMEYDGVVYKAVIEFPENRTDLGVALFECEDASKNMYLGLHWSTEHSKLMCQLYCPFWILNNTGKTLRYLESASSGVLPRSGSCTPCKKNRHESKADLAVLHEPDRNPILLPFADKNFLTKKKARLQVETSQWSDEFPLDVVGNSGRIVCKSNEGYDFEVTIDIQLCQSGLTKIVTLSPFYLLYNNSKFDLEAKEFSQDEWVKLPAQSCSGLWPKQKEKRKLIMGRYAGTEEESVMFPFTENFESFCRIDNDYLGLQVTCSVGEASSVVHLEPFLPGMVPVLVINHTDMPLEFCQKGAASMKTLGANETCFYTWTDVLSKRILYWKMGTYEQEAVLHKNDLRRFLPDNTHGYCMSMSFLYGRQRVLMLTTDTVMAEMAFEAYEVEQITQSIEITLAGLSLSVVDNGTSQEIIHMAMSSSDVVWERQQKYRFKPLALKNMAVFENAYQQWLVGGRPDGFVAVDKYHVDFDKMVMKTKKNIVQKIRRGFETGFWMQYRTSPHQTQIHMKMSHLQIDNQLPACVFPVVLAVVPPPKSVIADSAPKPFLEFSFLMRQSEHSNVVQVQYLRVLIQEFAVQVDQGLINALLQLTAGSTNVQPYNKELFDKDLAVTKAQLSDRAVSTASTQQKAYYDDLHISPLMIHLSFSQGGASKKGENDSLPIQSEFINVILKSVGVSVTELQDVVFKLAYFERQYVFYNRLQLQAEIQSHYMMQAVKQLYVLVLGLDIIGNPFGLVRDLSTGVEDLFYQPFQGLIQGPEEFAEGVALGVQSLFGHAVGGAAGAVSRITGTVGKGVAALTFDDEYQRKRQEALNRKPQNFSEGMARGAKGLTQGVYDGVTGVFMKPIEGARDGGAGGFAKGLGKGLIGVVTRPVSGVVDFASSSFDAVKTVASTSEAAKPIRPPRVILSDQIIRPYSPRDAVGSKIFRDTDRGKYADTDHFIVHAPISEKCVFIVTDNRVLLSRKHDVMGVWNADWVMTYAEIKAPERSPKGIRVLLKNPKKGFLGIGSTNGKLVEFVDAKVADNIHTKMTAAYEKAC